MGILTIGPRAAFKADIEATTRIRDWVIAASVAAVLVALTALPYLFGYLVAGPGREFMGIVLNVPDTAQYFSWARESMDHILIDNKLTPESGAAVYFNLFWWIIGRLAAATGLGIAETAQLVRPAVGAAYVLAIYWLVQLVARSPRERWTAFLVAVLGGGLGWLLVVAKQITGELAAPLDLYVTEANTFLTLMAFPLQAMAGALQVVILGLSALAFERRSPGLALGAGILGLALGVQHGYDLLIVYAVVGVLGLILALRDGTWLRTIGLGVLICGPSLPAAAYLALLTRASPIWRGVLAQYGNAGVYTPPPAHLVVLMGLPLVIVIAAIPFALLNVRHLPLWLRAVPPRELLIWTWLVVGLALIYIPTDFQIKMLACWQVPLAIVSTRLVLDCAARVPAWPRLSHWLAVALLVAVIPVNIYLLAWRFVDLKRGDYPYFLARDEVAALDWLHANTAPADIVLSSLGLGQYVPGVSGNTAFLAHWAQTLDYYAKQREVERYFSADVSANERADLMQRFDVHFVVVGPQERALGNFDARQVPSLTPVYANDSVTLYGIRP